MSSCLPEFRQCGGGREACCAPHRCFRQSRFYSQCGSACPPEASWECWSAPRVGLIVSRWGGWPAWSPLLVHSFSMNPAVTFLLVGDVGPALDLPPNVIFVPCTLAELTARSARIGGRLALANAASRFDSGVSAAKVNDLKPMFGELFAAELQPFDVWGHLQEDILLGNLSLLAAPRDLQQNDVISPYFAPLNASGVLMLYRNTRRIAQLWRTSADAQHVLTTERYQAFDEGWWGPLAARGSSMSAVFGREAERGAIRLGLASRQRRVMADDKQYGAASAPRFNAALVVCWQRGRLFVNPGRGGGPCLGLRRRTARRQVALVHLSLLKRHAVLAKLALPLALYARGLPDEFTITQDGLWLPSAQRADEQWLVSGQHAVRVATEVAARYVLALSELYEAQRCKPTKRSAECQGVPSGAPRRPCALGCAEGTNPDACRKLLSKLKMRLCM